MTFEEWMLHRGLSQSTAEKYAGAITGALSEWAIGGGILHGPLIAMDSAEQYSVVVEKLSELPIFLERNERGHNMYSSALARYGTYLSEGFDNDVESDIEKVFNDPNTTSTEKLELVKARIGQGKFRQQLVAHWRGCAVTGYKEPSLLVASHIKPWRASSNAERLDPCNGLLLAPNIDRAFDRGFVTFDEAGKLLISPLLSSPDLLGILPGQAAALTAIHQGYMAFHREKVYRAQ